MSKRARKQPHRVAATECTLKISEGTSKKEKGSSEAMELQDKTTDPYHYTSVHPRDILELCCRLLITTRHQDIGSLISRSHSKDLETTISVCHSMALHTIRALHEEGLLDTPIPPPDQPPA